MNRRLQKALLPLLGHSLHWGSHYCQGSSLHCGSSDFQKGPNSVTVSLAYCFSPLKLRRTVYCLSFHMFPRMRILASLKSVIGKRLTNHGAWSNDTLYSWLLSCVCVLVGFFPSPRGESRTYLSVPSLVYSVVELLSFLLLLQSKVSLTNPCFGVDWQLSLPSTKIKCLFFLIFIAFTVRSSTPWCRMGLCIDLHLSGSFLLVLVCECALSPSFHCWSKRLYCVMFKQCALVGLILTLPFPRSFLTYMLKIIIKSTCEDCGVK